MIGSIIGDIVGSVYEFDNIKTKEFELISSDSDYTDDSILTFATADWILHGGDISKKYCDYALAHPCPMGGYGNMFSVWITRGSRTGEFEPYNSCGNGSAMRVGPVGWAFDSKESTLAAAKASAECTHNHPEGIKGAQATALAIYMARTGAGKDEIRRSITGEFGYDLDFTCDSIRAGYGWGATCQDTVPQAIVAFMDGTDFEDCIRNAVSLGGDSDTLACITGSIAEAFYGVPDELRECAEAMLPAEFRQLLEEFESKYNTKY